MTTDTKITSTEAVVAAAFALHQDRLADEAVASLQRSLERIKSAYSNLSQDVYSCPRYGQIWRATLRDLCVRVDGTYELDMDKAQAWAKTWAQNEIAAAAKKLSAKVGRLVRAKVTGAPERGCFRGRPTLPSPLGSGRPRFSSLTERRRAGTLPL